MPVEQYFGSSHVPSFAYLQLSSLPPDGLVTGTEVTACVGVGVVGVAGADGEEVEDGQLPQVLGHAALIVAPCCALLQWLPSCEHWAGLPFSVRVPT